MVVIEQELGFGRLWDAEVWLLWNSAATMLEEYRGLEMVYQGGGGGGDKGM
jgi:hypothetical protein